MIQSLSANTRAFLQTIGISEGTVTSPITKNDGYDVIVTGIDMQPEIFTNYSTHPFSNGRIAKVINSKGLTSTASGKFQILARYYDFYKKQLCLPDFSPDSQDKIALQLIAECHALDDIDAGDFDSAVYKCRSRWASLPKAGYGQHENNIEKLRAAYTAAGGLSS